MFPKEAKRAEQKAARKEKQKQKDFKASLAKGPLTKCCQSGEDTTFWDERLPKLESAFLEALLLYRKQLLEEMSQALMQDTLTMRQYLDHEPLP